MKKNTKKILALSVLGLFIFVFAMQFVAAAGIDDPIKNPEWFVQLINFLGLGETWALFIVSVAILLMVFAATYDILSFTAFESDWVKYMIAGGVAVIVGVARGITALAALIMGIAGGSVVLGTGIAIIIAVVFFVMAGFFKGKMKAMKYREKSEELSGLMDLAAEAEAGKIKEAAAVLRAAKKV